MEEEPQLRSIREDIFKKFEHLRFAEIDGDQCSRFHFRMRDSTSIYLEISSTSGPSILLVLDLQAQIIPLSIFDKYSISKEYLYTRLSERSLFRITCETEGLDTESCSEEWLILDFFFSQYTRLVRLSSVVDSEQLFTTVRKEQQRLKANVIARGAESTGFAIRKGNQIC
jgi:hypothetical protein